MVDLPAFRIGRTPITNATFLHFVEGGGYERREWWTDEGWPWKEEYDITHPEAGPPGPTVAAVAHRRRAPLHPDEPVVHVSWFEADAFARAHGARLPTEAEWEKAATWDQETGRHGRSPGASSRRPRRRPRANLDQTGLGPSPAGALPDGAAPCGALGMLGDTWEWTATDVPRLPRLPRPPVPRVLRGLLRRRLPRPARRLVGDARRVATPTFRNWDLPQRRQIFSGVRLAWDG